MPIIDSWDCPLAEIEKCPTGHFSGRCDNCQTYLEIFYGQLDRKDYLYRITQNNTPVNHGEDDDDMQIEFARYAPEELIDFLKAVMDAIIKESDDKNLINIAKELKNHLNVDSWRLDLLKKLMEKVAIELS